MADENQEILKETESSDSKKGMTTWAVRLDSETKNIVAETMEKSGFTGIKFMRAVCEAFENRKGSDGAELPEELGFLDSLMSRTRNFMLAEHTRYAEAKKQLQEEKTELIRKRDDAKDLFNKAIEEIATLKTALEETTKQLSETKETLEKVERHESILLKKNEEMEKQLVDLDLWKTQAASLASRDERITILENQLEELRNSKADLEIANTQLEKSCDVLQNDMQRLSDKFEIETHALHEKFELERKMLSERLEVEKRNAVLEYLQSLQNETKKIEPEKFGEDELYKLICETEDEINSNNYLPIFHVRPKAPKEITRKQFDEMLRSLWTKKKINLSSLQEGRNYTAEQIAQGIPQNSGGPLFYIIIKERK